MAEVSRSFFGTIDIVDYNHPDRLYLQKEVDSMEKFATYIKKYGESAPYQSILKASVVPLRSNGSFKFVQDLLFPTFSHRMDIKNVDSVIGSTSRLAKTTWAIMAIALDILTLIPRLISAGLGKITDLEKHPIISKREAKNKLTNINYFKMHAHGQETVDDEIKKFSVIINISTNGLTEIDRHEFSSDTGSEFHAWLSSDHASFAEKIDDWLFESEAGARG